jgi:hypothetical protein
VWSRVAQLQPKKNKSGILVPESESPIQAHEGTSATTRISDGVILLCLYITHVHSYNGYITLTQIQCFLKLCFVWSLVRGKLLSYFQLE